MKLVSLLVFTFSLPAFSETFKISDVGAHPEAVHFDGKYFYASNLGVKANGDKDGDGYISVLGRDGSVIRKNILPSNVKLHTPTGMDHKDGYLFVVDMDRVVALPLYKRGLPFQIDLASSGATFLNDMVFVSDRHFVVTESKLQKLFLVDIKTKKFIELNYNSKLGAPNGITYDASRKLLVVASNLQHAIGTNDLNGQILVFDLNLTVRTSLTLKSKVSWGRFIDGVAIIPGTNQVYVSDWYAMDAKGRLGHLDFASGQVFSSRFVSVNGFADFQYMPKSNVFVAPDLISGEVHFFR